MAHIVLYLSDLNVLSVLLILIIIYVIAVQRFYATKFEITITSIKIFSNWLKLHSVANTNTNYIVSHDENSCSYCNEVSHNVLYIYCIYLYTSWLVSWPQTPPLTHQAEETHRQFQLFIQSSMFTPLTSLHSTHFTSLHSDQSDQ